MGNHEFCEQCYVSDFHYGQPCEPERLKKAQQERKEQADKEARCKAKATNIFNYLKAQGYPVQLENGHVVIHWWSLD